MPVQKRELNASMFCVISLSQGFRKARSAYIYLSFVYRKSTEVIYYFVFRRIVVVTLLPTRQQNDNDNICGLYDSPWRQKNKFCTKEKK